MVYRLALISFFALFFQVLYAQDTDSLKSTILEGNQMLQSRVDSISNAIKNSDFSNLEPDALVTGKLQELDSLSQEAQNEFARLKGDYDSVESRAMVASLVIQQKMDSLQNLSLPTTYLEQKIDSINYWSQEKIKDIQNRTERYKKRIGERIDSLGLPADLESKVSELTATLEEYQLDMPFEDWRDKLDIRMGKLDLPSTRVPGLDGIGKLDNPLSGKSMKGLDLPPIGDLELPQLEEVNIPDSPLGSIPQGLSTNEESLAVLAENEMVENAGGSLRAELEKATELSQTMELQSEEEAKQQMKQTAMQAMNHFEGKDAQLREAMNKMAEYKKKYSSVQSIADLPVKRPNPMKQKTFRERLVPGIMVQVQRSDAWWADFNPYVGYRLSGRLVTGLGWNQRFAYHFDRGLFLKRHQIYGPRVYGNYHVGKGFNGHWELESMNAWIPPQVGSIQTDVKSRAWIFSTMAGLKKDYTFLRKVKGTIYVLYNLYDPDRKSPYLDRLNMRLGFEFPQKKALQKKS